MGTSSDAKAVRVTRPVKAMHRLIQLASSCARPGSAGRCGMTYIIVLGATLIVSTLTLGGLLVVRSQSRIVQSYEHTSKARHYALSAIELGVQEIATNTNWRKDRKNAVGGIWYDNLPIDDGTYSLKVVNPYGPLDNSSLDPVTLTGTGRLSGQVEQQNIEVTQVPQKSAFTCLQTAETAGSAVSLGTTTLDCVNQIISSNAAGTAFTTDAGGANIFAQVEAVGLISGSTYSGPNKAGAPARTMPDPNSVFEYYIENGTNININALPTVSGVRSVRQRVLSPTANPFGATNPEGIYVIDCMGQAISFTQNRIVGTLVILNPLGSAGSFYDEQNFHVPAISNFPAILVKGDFAFKTNATALTETIGVNFNPAGTPYPYPSGIADIDTTDSYPNQVEGLIYVSGNLQTQSSPNLGQVVVQGSISHISGSLSLNNNPVYYSNPPPGFCTFKMTTSPGSWKQVVN